MSSEAALEAAPMVGNAHLGQRGSGHSVVSLPNTYPGIDLESCELGARRGCGQTMRARGVCAPALELPLAWEGPYSARWQAEPRSEPDSGNPTVRDRRGALRNVTHGGTRNPLRNRKSGSGHSSPKGARAQLLSRQPHARFGGRGGRKPFPTPIKSTQRWYRKGSLNYRLFRVSCGCDDCAFPL